MSYSGSVWLVQLEEEEEILEKRKLLWPNGDLDINHVVW
jgi:hypothetical protein